MLECIVSIRIFWNFLTFIEIEYRDKRLLLAISVINLRSTFILIWLFIIYLYGLFMHYLGLSMRRLKYIMLGNWIFNSFILLILVINLAYRIIEIHIRALLIDSWKITFILFKWRPQNLMQLILIRNFLNLITRSFYPASWFAYFLEIWWFRLC